MYKIRRKVFSMVECYDGEVRLFSTNGEEGGKERGTFRGKLEELLAKKKELLAKQKERLAKKKERLVAELVDRKKRLPKDIGVSEWEMEQANRILEREGNKVPVSYAKRLGKGIKGVWNNGAAGKAAIIVPTAAVAGGLGAGAYYGAKALKNRLASRKAQMVKDQNGDVYLVD